MVVAPSDPWPEDPDALALLAADGAQPDAIRQRALECLESTVRRVVRRLSLRFSGQQRRDLEDDALSDVWQRLTQFPGDGSFESWCYVVLRNTYIDRVRREESDRRRRTTLAESKCRSADLRAALERADTKSRFSPSDLRSIAGWHVRYRLALLCLTGLWTKVPDDVRATWSREYEDIYATSLPVPFPPARLEALRRPCRAQRHSRQRPWGEAEHPLGVALPW